MQVNNDLSLFIETTVSSDKYTCITISGMGTTLQHVVDLLAILPKKYKIYGIHNSDFREVFENNFFKNTLTGDSMDRRLEQFNQESVRMTMLKHEEIFKEQ
ncbi:hypothetical protein FRX31_019548, partial [Thalictrum thalictroides]